MFHSVSKARVLSIWMVTTPEAMRSSVCAQFPALPEVVGTGRLAGGAGAAGDVASGGGSAGGAFSAGAAQIRADNRMIDRSRALRSMPIL